MSESNRSLRPKIVGVLALVCLAHGAGAAFAGDYQYFDRSDKIFPGAGDSSAHNIAVQTINPWPPYVRNDRITIDGRRIELGYRRYQANRSIPPRGLATTDIQLNVASPNGASSDGDLGASPIGQPTGGQ